jgi:hypothetical protein
MIFFTVQFLMENAMKMHLKPHCIQSSQVLVPAGTSKSTLRRHGIQAALN